MRGIAKAFFISALVYGMLGLLRGIHMAIGQDRAQLPTHAHIMVIGWLSFAVFGFFYHFFGQAMPQLLASLHFWVPKLRSLLSSPASRSSFRATPSLSPWLPSAPSATRGRLPCLWSAQSWRCAYPAPEPSNPRAANRAYHPRNPAHLGRIS